MNEKHSINRIQSYFAFCLLFVAGCASSPVQTQKYASPLQLSDSQIRQYSGNSKSLFREWLEPISVIPNSRKGLNYAKAFVPHQDVKQLRESARITEEVFNKFCRISDGVFVTNSGDHHTDYRCVNNKTNMSLGELRVAQVINSEDIPGYWLFIQAKSGESINIIAEENEKLAKEAQLNGPTGWLITADGVKHRLLRFGDFNERHVVEVVKNNDHYPIDQIKALEFDKVKGYIFSIRLFEGAVVSDNRSFNIFRRVSAVTRSSYGYDGIPIVLVDPTSNEPYTRIFRNEQGIQSITLDAKDTWQDKKATKIESKLNPVSKERSDVFLANKKKEAAKKFLDINMQPSERTLTTIHSVIDDYAYSKTCKMNIATGVIDLVTPLSCQQALIESNLIKKGVFSANATPLAVIKLYELLNPSL